MPDLTFLIPGLATIAGAALILAWRVRETRRPVSPRSIILPPLGMSTGFSMFLVPDFRVSWEWALGAFVVGAVLLAVPLVRSSKLALQGDTVVMRRSRAFLAIIIGLAGLRLVLREQVAHILPARQTAAVFFVLAFGMIVRWRTWMWFEYKKLVHHMSMNRARSSGVGSGHAS